MQLKKRSYFAPRLIFHLFHRLTVCLTVVFLFLFFVFLFFFSPTKGITPKICRVCVCVLINKHSFEPFMCLDLVLER